MNTQNHSKTNRKGKHLKREDKLFFESAYNNDVPPSTLAVIYL